MWTRSLHSKLTASSVCSRLHWSAFIWHPVLDCISTISRGKSESLLLCLLLAPDEDVLKGKPSIRSPALGHQNSESEILVDGDDDTLSSLEEKEFENLTGKTPPYHFSKSLRARSPALTHAHTKIIKIILQPGVLRTGAWTVNGGSLPRRLPLTLTSLSH